MELVAVQVVGARLDQLNAPTGEPPRSPLEIVRWWLSELERDAVPFATLVQIWGEAASGSGMRDVVQRRMRDIEDGFASAVERWLTATGHDPGGTPAVASVMLTCCQGYILRGAVLGQQDPSSSFVDLDLFA